MSHNPHPSLSGEPELRSALNPKYWGYPSKPRNRQKPQRFGSFISTSDDLHKLCPAPTDPNKIGIWLVYREAWYQFNGYSLHRTPLD